MVLRVLGTGVPQSLPGRLREVLRFLFVRHRYQGDTAEGRDAGEGGRIRQLKTKMRLRPLLG